MTHLAASRVMLLLALTLLGWCPERVLATETVQLTQSQALFHQVTQPSVSPDGARVIFVARLHHWNTEHLYSVAVGGGPVTQLTAPAEPPQTIENPTITHDSQRVIFRANLDDPSIFQLYTVPIAGGSVTPLNGSLLPGGEVRSDWQMSPDGRRVVFRAEQTTPGVLDLYSAPIQGGSVTPLTSLGAQGLVLDFFVAPDSSRVAVISDQNQNDVFELMILDIDGGPATVLNGPLVSGGDVINAWFSPDSSAIVYLADQEVHRQLEIFHVATTGGPTTRLNGTLEQGRDVFNAAFTPTGGRVVYQSDQGGFLASELFSVPALGGPSTKISGTMVSGGGVSLGWQIDPVSQRVIYRADQETDDVVELFSVTPTGGLLSKLNGPLQSEGDVQSQVQVHQGRVFFRADDQENGLQELFSTTVNGDDLVRLNAPILRALDSVFSSVHAVQLMGDEAFFIAPQDSVVAQLFRVPIDGGPVTKVNDGDGFVNGYVLGPDGEQVFYVSDETAAGQSHLFQHTLNGLGPAIRLNDEPTSEARGRVQQLQVSETFGRMVYRASHLELRSDLFSQPLAGGAPVRLSGDLVAGGEVEGFAISPDGSRVVYVADQETAGTWEIYWNHVQGGALRKLSLPPSEGGANADLQLAEQPFTPDGSRVVYAAFLGGDPSCGPEFLDYQLYSVTTPGGAPVRLNEDLDLCTLARDFEIGSTGERVVYTTSRPTSNLTSLLSVPVDGGPPTLLHRTLASGSFALTPDASRVVFSGRDATGHETLYSIPTVGGEPVPLSRTEGGVEVGDFLISNDGSRVVFNADQDTAETFELFSVPIDGGKAVKISGDLAIGGDVHRFELSPGLGRVVFLADKDTDDLTEAYSVSVQGGEVTRLNQDLPMGGDEVLEIAISADSSLVALILGEVGPFDRIELHALYTVPLTGGTVHRLSLPLEGGEELGPEVEFSDDGSYVLYQRLDDDSDLVYFRAPSRGGLAQRFTPAEIRVIPSNAGASWFSSDGSRLIFAGLEQRFLPEELWLSFELDLFRDGFELGDTSAWSNQVP